ncbi:hypothetical protein LZ32DRAFT_159597 [Colletotrichum eremochloae]|nr:hypothetical protein LZ32DRAFT_159597 [Colletotrichum eremochloae]
MWIFRPRVSTAIHRRLHNSGDYSVFNHDLPSGSSGGRPASGDCPTSTPRPATRQRLNAPRDSSVEPRIERPSEPSYMGDVPGGMMTKLAFNPSQAF